MIAALLLLISLVLADSEVEILAAACTDIANNYLPNSEAAETFCQAITTNVDSPLVCTGCKDIIGTFEDIANDPEKTKELLSNLINICLKLPTRFEQECEIVLDLYAPVVLDAARNGYSPERVCADLEMC